MPVPVPARRGVRVRVELGLRLVPALETLRQKAPLIYRVDARLLLRLSRAGATAVAPNGVQVIL